MKLISAKYHNFMSFGETDNVINFDEVFDDDETLLVIGMRDGDPEHSNGSGKSTIVEGLCYNFFGKLPRIVAQNPGQKGEVAKQIIRTDDDDVFVAGESYVETRFITADGRTWRLKRGRKVDGKRTGHSRILELECEGDSVGGRRGDDAEKQIAGILRFSFESLVNSCMFAQRDSGKFLGGSNGVKKDLFMELVGVQIVDRMLANVRKRKSTVNKEHVQIQAKIDVMKDRLAESSLEEDPVQQEAVWNEDLKRCDEEISILDKKLVDSGVEPIREQCDILTKEIEVIRTEYVVISNERQIEIEPIAQSSSSFTLAGAEAKTEIAHVEELKRNMQEEYDRILPKIVPDEKLADVRLGLDMAKVERDKWSEKAAVLSEQHITANAAVQKIEADIRHNTGLTESIQTFLRTGEKGEPCPSCGSQWNEESAQEEIARQQAKIDAAKLELDAAAVLLSEIYTAKVEAEQKRDDADKKLAKEAEYQRFKSESEEATKRTEQIKVEAAQVKQRHEAAEQKLADAKVQLDELQKQWDIVEAKHKTRLDENASRLDSKETELRGRQVQVKEAEAVHAGVISCKSGVEKHKSEISTKLAVLASKIEESKKDHAILNKTIAEIAVVGKRLNRLLVLEEVMSKDGFKTRVAEKYVPHMKRYANEFLSLLSPDMSLDIKMDGNEISIAVDGASSSDYLMCSGGEQEAIRLAVNMANSMISIGGNSDLPGIVLLDEIFGSLDPMTRRNVFTLLERLREYFPRIVVITHDSALQKWFSKRLLVMKEGKVSRIEGLQKIS